MTAAAHVRRWTYVQADRRAAILVGLFAVVIGAALYARPLLLADGVESAVDGTTASQQAAGGVAWAVLEAVFAGVLLLTILLWRRLPDWLREIAKGSGKIGALMLIGAYAYFTEQFGLYLVAGVGFYALAKTADELDVWWLINNAMAIGLAAYLAALVGITLGPLFVGVGLIGLSVYDHVFANRETWMFDLADWSLRSKLPLLVLVPDRLRYPWAETVEDVEDEEETRIWGIGMADLLLPAAFAVGLAHAGYTVALVGAVAGVLIACLRISWSLDNEGSGAGLPPLTAGTLGGWAVGAAMVVAL